jgi:hypothetical protein
MEADVDVDGGPNPLHQVEIELLGDRVSAVEVANGGGERVDFRVGDERSALSGVENGLRSSA